MYNFLCDSCYATATAIADIIIFLSYISIPTVLLYVLYEHRRRVPNKYRVVVLLFGCFILFCGTGHLIEVFERYNGTFSASVELALFIFKVLTALVSAVTALAVLYLIPIFINFGFDSMDMREDYYRNEKLLKNLQYMYNQQTIQLNSMTNVCKSYQFANLLINHSRPLYRPFAIYPADLDLQLNQSKKPSPNNAKEKEKYADAPSLSDNRKPVTTESIGPLFENENKKNQNSSGNTTPSSSNLKAKGKVRTHASSPAPTVEMVSDERSTHSASDRRRGSYIVPVGTNTTTTSSPPSDETGHLLPTKTDKDKNSKRGGNRTGQTLSAITLNSVTRQDPEQLTLEELLSNPFTVEIIKDILIRSYCVQLIFFLFDIRKFNVIKKTRLHFRRRIALNIYETYVSDSAIYQIPLSHAVKIIIEKSITNLSRYNEMYDTDVGNTNNNNNKSDKNKESTTMDGSDLFTRAEDEVLRVILQTIQSVLPQSIEFLLVRAVLRNEWADYFQANNFIYGREKSSYEPPNGGPLENKGSVGPMEMTVNQSQLVDHHPAHHITTNENDNKKGKLLSNNTLKSDDDLSPNHFKINMNGAVPDLSPTDLSRSTATTKNTNESRNLTKIEMSSSFIQ